MITFPVNIGKARSGAHGIVPDMLPLNILKHGDAEGVVWDFRVIFDFFSILSGTYAYVQSLPDLVCSPTLLY